MGGFFSAPRPTAASPNIKVIPKLIGMTFFFFFGHAPPHSEIINRDGLFLFSYLRFGSVKITPPPASASG